LDLLVGGPDDATEEEQEARRAAIVEFTGLLACVVEAPKVPLDPIEPLFIDGGAIPHPKVHPPAQFGALPADAFAVWIFLHDYNSFMYIAAHGASLTWQ
jgi:hypothetical protein